MTSSIDSRGFINLPKFYNFLDKKKRGTFEIFLSTLGEKKKRKEKTGTTLLLTKTWFSTLKKGLKKGKEKNMKFTYLRRERKEKRTLETIKMFAKIFIPKKRFE